MRASLTLLGLSLLLAIAGCSKSDTVQSPQNPPAAATPEPEPIDACSLIASSDVEAVQGGPVKDTKPSLNSQGGLDVAQCYFLLPTASDSIVLTVTQKGRGSNAREPKQSWDEIFHGDKDKEAASKEEEGKAEPPEKIDGLGDESYWAPRRFGGALYALKGNIYISISVGGAADKASKLQKSKALAEIILKHL